MVRAGLAVVSLLALSSFTAAPARDLACASDGATERWVPAGETQIGDDQGYADEGPAYRTYVDGFWIDRTEVTNARFAAFVAATGYVTTAERVGESAVFSPPAAGQLPTAPDQWWKLVRGANWRHPQGPGSDLTGKGNLPVVHVSHADALAYADWAGRRLPSEEEFEHAARAGVGSASRESPPPDSANTWQGEFPRDNLKSDGFDGLAPVGCYKADELGINDLIGNAWEWTQSWYLPGHGPQPTSLAASDNPSFDPRQPGERVRVIKGGSFLCAPNYCARYRPAARHAQGEAQTSSHISFRTARD